jgi:perosamine synthetase
MLTTDSVSLAKKIALMKQHCMTRTAYEREKLASWRYDITGLGYNYRMTDMQCALARSQLSRIETMTKGRTSAARYYTKMLGAKTDKIVTPYEGPDRRHVYHLYTILVDSRDAIFSRLSRSGIGLSVHFRPLHQMTYYKRALQCRASDFPVAETVSKRNLSLPLFPEITRKEQDFVIGKLVSALEHS